MRRKKKKEGWNCSCCYRWRTTILLAAEARKSAKRFYWRGKVFCYPMMVPRKMKKKKKMRRRRRRKQITLEAKLTTTTTTTTLSSRAKKRRREEASVEVLLPLRRLASTFFFLLLLGKTCVPFRDKKFRGEKGEISGGKPRLCTFFTKPTAIVYPFSIFTTQK